MCSMWFFNNKYQTAYRPKLLQTIENGNRDLNFPIFRKCQNAVQVLHSPVNIGDTIGTIF